MALIEANFDGIVGPTHNYAGLSWGNVASKTHGGLLSRPREAALQGLAKAKYLADLGLMQGVLPPQERPDVRTLRQLGFTGDDRQVIERAAREAPRLLALCSSGSSMWAANAATVAPGADSSDGRTHFTPANLRATFHRSIEPPTTAEILRRVFPDPERFVHHQPLPGGQHLGDEGAANHTRLHAPGARRGVHVFVYGRRAFGDEERSPTVFPARQTREASEAVARLHGLDAASTLFVQQNPVVIDAGVFHNDVIAVGHRHVLLHHELAFAEGPAAIERMRRALDGALVPIEVSAREAAVDTVVRSYLFNSQLVTVADGSIALVAPTESRDDEPTHRAIQRILADDNPIAAVHFLDVRQSMRNGGGPACLRLRVQLDEADRQAVHAGCVLDDALYARLVAWVERHYREELSPDDLRDPALLEESRAALDDLTAILDLGSLYPFQGI